MSKRDLLLYLMLEEVEDEEIILQPCEGNAETQPIFQTRIDEGCFEQLINRHLLKDNEKFREYFRLNIEQFNYVLDLVKEDLKKDSSPRYPYPISPEEKLALTLRFMATGETFRSLAFAFRISSSYITKIIQIVLSVLHKKLLPILLPPISPDQLKSKCKEFEQKWQFPNCVGAIDGKHVRIFSPALSGSLYYNYKHFFSTVLLAVVDANYKFIFIDVGSYGKEGDSGIFDKSNIGKLFASGNMFPPPSKLPNSDIVVPYVFVGDEAFRLHPNMMKPFSRRIASTDNKKAIFNYRLSRARRVSENAFALLSQIFRIFYSPIGLKPETTDSLVIVACCLHNLLRDAFLEKNNEPHYELNRNEPLPTKNLGPLTRSGGYAHAEGFSVRDSFTEYFNSRAGAGITPWQGYQVTRTQ